MCNDFLVKEAALHIALYVPDSCSVQLVLTTGTLIFEKSEYDGSFILGLKLINVPAMYWVLRQNLYHAKKHVSYYLCMFYYTRICSKWVEMLSGRAESQNLCKFFVPDFKLDCNKSNLIKLQEAYM
jgi:hypothetical protein